MEKFNQLTKVQVVKALTDMSSKWSKPMIQYYINQSYYYPTSIERQKFSKSDLLAMFERIIKTNDKCRNRIIESSDLLKALIVAHITIK